jgi:hypothetical protein
VLFFCLFSLVCFSAASQSSPSIASDQAPSSDLAKTLLPKLEEADSLVRSLKLSQDSRDMLMLQRELRLKASEEDLKQKEVVSEQREADLSQRGQILKGRENSLSRMAEALAVLQTSLDNASLRLKELAVQARRDGVKIMVFRGLVLTASGGLGGHFAGSALGNNSLTPIEIGLAAGAIGGVLWSLRDLAHSAGKGE